MNGNLKTTLIVLVLAVVLALLFFVVMPNITVNNAIGQEKLIEAERKNITVLVNRKVTVLTNLVKAVEQSAIREEEILSAVIGLRNSSGDAVFENSAVAISALAEAYPELKSIEGYSNLMTEISITENGLSQARIAYNGLVKNYQTFVLVWPNRDFLNVAGYVAKDYQQIEYDEAIEQDFKLFGE